MVSSELEMTLETAECLPALVVFPGGESETSCVGVDGEALCSLTELATVDLLLGQLPVLQGRDFSVKGNDVEEARCRLPLSGPSGLEKDSNEWIFCLNDRFPDAEVLLKLTPKVLATSGGFLSETLLDSACSLPTRFFRVQVGLGATGGPFFTLGDSSTLAALRSWAAPVLSGKAGPLTSSIPFSSLMAAGLCVVPIQGVTFTQGSCGWLSWCSSTQACLLSTGLWEHT